MAKKSFKGGIGNLLKESLDITNNNSSSEPNQESKERITMLERQIERLNEELWRWRTGRLNLEKFHESLKKHKLIYNPETNAFEKERSAR